MNKTNQRGISALVALLLMSGSVLAEDGAVGSVEVGGGELLITPNVSYAELQVTVAGEGVYWQKAFAPGENVSASLAEIGALTDGSYGYEVIAAPAVDKKAWKAADGDEAAERLLEEQEEAKTFMQQGGFQVVSGQVVIAAPREHGPDDSQQLAEPRPRQ